VGHDSGRAGIEGGDAGHPAPTAQVQHRLPVDPGGLSLGCRTFLSCISKGFGGFCPRLLRLRTGKRSSAFRWHGFADIF
jgi:hypothetical protein